MTTLMSLLRWAFWLVLLGLAGATALAQTPPTTAPATSATKTPPATTLPSNTPPSTTTPSKGQPSQGQPNPGQAAPAPTTQPSSEPNGKPTDTEIEPNGSPGIPDNATTESVTVPARPIFVATGTSTYDDAFKSIKASLDKVKVAMDKAGVNASGHPVTIFSDPGDKTFTYKAGIPVAAADDKHDLGAGLALIQSPVGKAIKFQHRGAYDDIDSTYDVITAYLDAKGLQVQNPYIEEYLTDLTTPDDPNLQVDIYVFVK